MHWLNKCLSIVQKALLGEQCPLCFRTSSNGGLCDCCLACIPLAECACVHCGARLAEEVFIKTKVCGSCISQPTRPGSALMACWYRPPVDEWIVRYKFHQDWAQGAILTDLLVRRIRQFFPVGLPDILIPVPMHPARLRTRGYNPAADIANQLSRQFSIPVDYALVRKKRFSRPQMELSYRQRVANVKGSFEMARDTVSRHIAIVDDVVTTGATVGEITRLLLRNSPATRISIWALARAVRQ